MTQFFRDPDAFAALQTALISAIVERKTADETVRIWVPACSTGEEAYSITVLLKEAMEKQGRTSKIQVFGTDLDESAVAFARSGRYRSANGISPEVLRRWFVEDADEVRPIRSVRDVCAFSIHSVIKDPPFSRVDLISCRNLLIYLNHDLQDKVLRTFEYSLNPGGVLFLGPSEGITRHGTQFVAINKKHSIFERTDAPTVLPALQTSRANRDQPVVRPPSSVPTDDPVERSARRALEKYSPVYVVVDGHHNILRFSGGEAGRYLEPSAGAASLELFNNLQKALRPIVRTALRRATSTQGPVSQDVEITVDGKERPLTVIVEPISERGVGGVMFLVAFVEGRAPLADNKNQAAGTSTREEGATKALNRELLTTKAQLQATVEDLETANEEMRSISEEYQSVNEELQSTNEELETSKEEMQSINEELQTVNAEMFAKNEALTVLNSDFKNLLDSTQIATIFLDDDLCIKSFTPGMMDIFRLREADRGRPIGDIVPLVDYSELQRDFLKVLRELTTIERELQLRESAQTFIMRIRPYRTVENKINGVVITFVDISARKRADLALQTSEQRYSAIVRQAPVGVAETDLDGRILHANTRFSQVLGRSEDALQTLRLDDVIYREDLRSNRALFNRLLTEGTAFQTETRFIRPDGTLVWVHNNVAPLVDPDGRPHRVLTVTLEIGERKRAEEHASLLLGELDHRVKNILSIISSVITQTLKTSTTPSDFAAAMEGRIAAIARAHSLLTDGGRGAASLRDLVLTELAPYDRTTKNISIAGPPVALTPRAGLAFAMAIHELAGNAAKYGGLSTTGGSLAVIWVLDDKEGMLRFSWTEADGPPIAKPPSRRGFGTTLIERSLSHEFDAIVKREFLLTGLRCSIDIPLSPEVIYASPSDQVRSIQ